MKPVTLAFATWLWAETRGLPFFIEALLQMLIEQGVLVPVEGRPSTYNFAAALEHIRSVAQVPLPPGVREIIRLDWNGIRKKQMHCYWLLLF